jgi:integrase
MIALEWTDIDFGTRQVAVARSDWAGEVTDTPMTQKAIAYLAGRASKRAGVNKHGVHILRHTFCSQLATRNAPMKAIQELAGHADLSTTMRYMHLSPASRDGAIKLLERGDSGEAGSLAAATR